MNSFIETLNHRGENFLQLAWPMLWQSSLLIAVVLAFEFLLRRQLRASIRYALWLVVLVKLILPPTLAMPTSPAWWWHEKTPPLEVKTSTRKFTITYDQTPLPEMPPTSLPVFVPPKPALTLAAWSLIFSASTSIALFAWLLVRWWQITRQVRRAYISERLTVLACQAKNDAGMNFKSPLVKLTTNAMSPAVCGLFRPTILIPQSLAAEFSDDQMRAVLLHELIHLRRRDVWVNFLQSLLQIIYWWHPLVWVANARIRRVREEAVDDAVMLALGGTAEIYAPTLLEVAKLALNRPLASLGLVGILESRSALRQRIERLVNFNAPRKAGLTLVSLLGILVFSAVAVPMGEGPSPTTNSPVLSTDSSPSATPVAVWHTNNDSIAGSNSVPGILTNPKFVEALHQLEKRTGTETLTNPKPTVVTRHSGSVNTMDPSVLTAMQGKLSWTNPAPVVGIVNAVDAKVDANGLVQDGKVYYEMGKLDGAEAKLKAALALDPENKAAHYYLNLVHQTRNAPQASSGPEWVYPSRDANVKSNNTPSRITMTFKIGHPISEAALQKLFLDAGVQIPSTRFFYHSENDHLLVTGTKEQMTLVFRVVLKLNGVSPPDSEARIRQMLDGYVSTATKDSAATNLLVTRTFKVNAYTFVAASENILGWETNNASVIARGLFTKLGLDLESSKDKSVFYNERLGLLVVRATEEDLDTVDGVIQAMNQGAPQVHIKARFIEVPAKVFQDLAPDLFTDAAMKSDTNGWHAFLTNPKFQVVVNQLLSLGTSQGEELAEPEVVTTSGRQTQMRATTLLTVVTNFAFVKTATNSSMIPQTEPVEIGPMIDLVPYVLADGYTINLTAIPTLVTFLGSSESPKENIPLNEGDVHQPVVSPNFSIRQAAINVNMRDNQTLVLGKLPKRFIENGKDVATGSKNLVKAEADDKELLVFVTATIVDSTGNRVHNDGELPFSKTGFPSQPH